MLVFHNPHHAAHSGRHEMYRGRLVPCHEVPARLQFVLDELQRRPVGPLAAAVLDDAALDASAVSADAAAGVLLAPRTAGLDPLQALRAEQ